MAASDADLALIDELSRSLRDERRRAPTDLLAILTVLILGAAIVLLAIGIGIGPGVWQDVALNLTAECIGAAITVVAIGGLWERFRTTSFREIDELVERVDAHRSTGLTEEEREAFRLVVELHRSTRSSNVLARQVRGTIFALRNRRRLRVLEDVLHPAARS